MAGGATIYDWERHIETLVKCGLPFVYPLPPPKPATPHKRKCMYVVTLAKVCRLLWYFGVQIKLQSAMHHVCSHCKRDQRLPLHPQTEVQTRRSATMSIPTHPEVSPRNSCKIWANHGKTCHCPGWGDLLYIEGFGTDAHLRSTFVQPLTLVPGRRFIN